MSPVWLERATLHHRWMLFKICWTLSAHPQHLPPSPNSLFPCLPPSCPTTGVPILRRPIYLYPGSPLTQALAPTVPFLTTIFRFTPSQSLGFCAQLLPLLPKSGLSLAQHTAQPGRGSYLTDKMHQESSPFQGLCSRQATPWSVSACDPGF